MSIKTNFENNRERLSRLVRTGENRLQSSPTSRVELSPSHKKEFLNGAFGSSMHNQSYSSYLEFHRNEALAASLRSERDARIASFNNLKDEFMRSKRVMVETICRSKVQSKDHFLEHRDRFIPIPLRSRYVIFTPAHLGRIVRKGGCDGKCGNA